jgi:hypothetical protein
MRVGTMFLGQVEDLDHECIETKFFVLGVPLFPMESWYVTGRAGLDIRGILLPTVHGTSVLAGYLRIGLWIVALLAAVFGWIEHRSYDPQYGLFGLAALAVVAWVPAQFVLGRLSERERARRVMLRAAIGLGAPPELLPMDTRSEMQRKLERAWAAKHPGQDWPAALKEGKATGDDAALLFALAAYDGDPAHVAAAEPLAR